jgi:hypothetical protein
MTATTMTVMKMIWGAEEQNEEQDSMPVETDDESLTDHPLDLSCQRPWVGLNNCGIENR